MYQFIETIRVENGLFCNINLHNLRMNSTRKHFFNASDNIYIQDCIKIPDEYKTGIYKCRLVYDILIRETSFTPYHIRPIQSLKIIHSNTISYNYKTTNRNEINVLFDKRESCDDIIIVKNGFITDSSYCNLVFDDGSRLVTPLTPLLKGVQRQKLLNGKLIVEDLITIHNLKNFKHVYLINAMITLDEATKININNIST